MTTLDDLELFDAPTPPSPAATPRKCYRHQWALRPGREGQPDLWVCRSCPRVRDVALGRQNKNNRARGGREEAKVASLLGGRKVGPLGLPHDVEVPGYGRFQVKQLDRWPSLARVIQWLDAMQPAGDVRGVTVADTPGPGGRTRRLLIVDLDEYAAYHGGKGDSE